MTGSAPINVVPAFRAALQNQAAKRRPAPLSLRLSPEERARLERDAAGRSLGAYIRARLFGEQAAPAARSRGKFPVKDHQALAKVLAQLGQSRLANNLNQLAKAVHLGALPAGPETEEDLRRAAYDIACMKMLLMRALGTGED